MLISGWSTGRISAEFQGCCGIGDGWTPADTSLLRSLRRAELQHWTALKPSQTLTPLLTAQALPRRFLVGTQWIRRRLGIQPGDLLRGFSLGATAGSLNATWRKLRRRRPLHLPDLLPPIRKHSHGSTMSTTDEATRRRVVAWV